MKKQKKKPEVKKDYCKCEFYLGNPCVYCGKPLKPKEGLF